MIFYIWKCAHLEGFFEGNIDHYLNSHVKEHSVKFSELADAPPLHFVLVSFLLFADF